jgi:hypothetical protein
MYQDSHFTLRAFNRFIKVAVRDLLLNPKQSTANRHCQQAEGRGKDLNIALDYPPMKIRGKT